MDKSRDLASAIPLDLDVTPDISIGHIINSSFTPATPATEGISATGHQESLVGSDINYLRYSKDLQTETDRTLPPNPLYSAKP